MKTRAIWALSILLFVPVLSHAQVRKRVVILQFDDRSVGQGMLGMNAAHIGARLSDELISKLTALGTFEIIDQEHLPAAIQEQNQGYGDRFSAADAVKLGKLAGKCRCAYLWTG